MRIKRVMNQAVFPLSKARLSTGTLCVGSALALAACGAGQSEPAQAPVEEPAAPESDEDVSAEEAELLAQIEESADIADEEAEASAASEDDEEKREVLYRVSPEGLKVEVSGVEFTPTVEAVKVQGAWGLKLSVQAEASQESILYSPKGGPMAFGGKISRGSETEKFGTRREGGIEINLKPGAPVAFSRTWPGEGQKGLAPGDELELHVMLWGLGPDTESRRPVAKFLLVKMKADKKGARPELLPPQ